MNQILEQLFKEPEKKALTPQELSLLSKFVSSLPERIKLYRQLREQETKLMQKVVDQLPSDLTQDSTSALEQSVKQSILMLRYAAMGMLVDDQQLAKNRLEGWLPTMAETYQTQAIDQALYQQLLSQLKSILSNKQMMLLQPGLELAQKLIAPTETDPPLTAELLEIG